LERSWRDGEDVEHDGGIVTPVVLQALGRCADGLSRDWDIDTYCQDAEWKEVIVQWKSRQLHAAARQVDEDGLDAENSPFLKLSVQEEIQAVRDGEEEVTVPVETEGSEETDI
jgi:hypothetical protein